MAANSAGEDRRQLKIQILRRRARSFRACRRRCKQFRRQFDNSRVCDELVGRHVLQCVEPTDAACARNRHGAESERKVLMTVWPKLRPRNRGRGSQLLCGKFRGDSRTMAPLPNTDGSRSVRPMNGTKRCRSGLRSWASLTRSCCRTSSSFLRRREPSLLSLCLSKNFI